MGRYLTGIVVMMWALVLLGGAFRPAGEAAGVGVQVGQKAPPLQGTTPAGQPLGLADLSGKAVFVNFWASWCGPCRLEMPEVQRLATNPPPGAAVLTVNTEASPEVVRRFVQEHGYDLPVLHDAGGQAAIDFQVLSLPTSLFISPDGVITARVAGPLTYGAMVDYLEAAGR
ncbi:MAG TPA: TlpA disulfide reductase family protein [Symbiobacteriaceae bacterium]|nr:TlpA disulfide reductase family protein [Symbiobacteriaceae bacterium]